MAERLKIHEINKIKERTVFFDANVFLDIFWPTGRNQTAILYSRFFKNCLINRISIVVDFIVLSEVINRALRMEYGKYLQQNNLTQTSLPFKNYRDSSEGVESQEDIYVVVKKSLDNFSVCGKEFTKEEIVSFLKTDSIDFNDKGITSLCRNKKFVLVTHDKDYSEQDIDVISANEKIS